MSRDKAGQKTAEQQRLLANKQGQEAWDLWGPYLAERAWGTVREDYSEHGTAWEYFPHDHARSRSYRWNEDGLGGISDKEQRLCFAFALWNGVDPILKERAFGLTGNQGNRGEDVKELYYYQDATPSHSYLRYRYLYPQQAYPYEQLVRENQQRSRQQPPFNLIDTGVLQQGYWDVDIRYAKQTSQHIYIKITLKNSGPHRSDIHVLPQLWFRNDWAWGDDVIKPQLSQMNESGAGWGISTHHSTLGDYYCYGETDSELLFTENETNQQRLWSVDNHNPYVKDSFHRYLIQGETEAINPEHTGTKAAACYHLQLEAGETQSLQFCLSAKALSTPFKDVDRLWQQRIEQSNEFYHALLPEADQQDQQIVRQAISGMIWSKQYFHFDVNRWMRGDTLAPPPMRKQGRNAQWQHMQAADIISMPDCWEYPWFAAWDLAFQAATLSLADIEFAKAQIKLMVSDRYLHPNGQIPAYEWSFSDVNPPVHGWGALKVFRAERVQTGQGDIAFLEQVFHKLLLNYAWWINRKDSDGHNLFEGGFLGLDNISVYDRSRKLAPGYSLKQADASGWMAMFAANMAVMALEINTHNADYEDIAIQCFKQFLAIANSIAGTDDAGVSLWDMDAGFFKDLLITPENDAHHIDVYSWVGLIPLFACEVIDQRLLENAPRFRKLLKEHKKGLFHGQYICACPEWENSRGEHLLALVDHSQLPRILNRLLSEDEFLSDYGIRSVSKVHAHHKNLGYIPGLGETQIEYVPGESNSGLFGGNSNWRGPIWMPTNYALIQALEKYHRFLGDDFTVAVPCLNNQKLSLAQIANLIADRLVNLYRRDEHQQIPAMRNKLSGLDDSFEEQQLYTFYEYFHAETGQGLGAAHQTGWTGLIANLVMRKYRKDIPAFWQGDK